jgi:hypothetical protein
MTPDDNDVWVRNYFVIRRPYLFVYTSASESEEIAALSLANLTVKFGPSLFQVGPIKPFHEFRTLILAYHSLRLFSSNVNLCLRY